MYDRIDLTLNASVAGSHEAVLEFYDPNDSTTYPDTVTVGTNGLDFDCNTLLGTARDDGALVTITYIKTGAKYKGYTTWVGGKNTVASYSYFGQTSPSTNESDYLVSAEWRPVTVDSDTTLNGNSMWGQSGIQEITLPQSRINKWLKYNLYDHATATDNYAFFLRLRIIIPAGASGMIPTRVRIDRGKQYALVALIQGETVEDNPLASSTGLASQEYFVSRKPAILGSFRVFVDEGGGEFEYIAFSSLLNSTSTDRHCRVDYLADGTTKLIFGDGVNGKIPPIGANNIRCLYRIGGNVNGNVGAGTLTVNRDGASVFRNITNPRQGRYWIEADWASESALERTKQRGLRQLRTMFRATNSRDIVTLATRFQTQAGTRPILRAKAYEEGRGPKTVELIVAGKGGASLSSLEIQEVEEYFNGGSTWGYPGVSYNNTRVYVTNYIPRIIPLTVRIEAYDTITETMVKQLLSAVVEPGAISSNGYSFLWRYGQTVALSKIASEVFTLAPDSIFDVDINSPTADVILTPRELPILDIVNTSVVIVPPSFIE
jgi:hypothetical protein